MDNSSFLKTRFTFLFFSMTIIISCINKEGKTYNEKYLLNYKNGDKYCIGNFKVIESGRNKEKVKDGIWNYYWFNGNLSESKEFQNGKLLSFKEFDESGKILKAANYNIEFDYEIKYVKYFENGNIKTEINTELITDNDYENGNDILNTITTTKEYYKNGQLKLLKKEDYDSPIGKTKIWDNLGNLILEFKEQ